MKKLLSVLAITSISLFAASTSFAEGETPIKPVAVSTVSGTVVDITSGETLAGVAVTIEGTDLKVYTDLDGNFTMNDIKPGTYNLILSMISYKNSLIENVELLPDEKEKMEIKLDNK